MTEAQWLACEDAAAMSRFLKVGASGRKLRLLACACVSRLLPLAKIVPDLVRAGLEEVERYADEMSTKAALKRVRERMAEARASTPSHRTTADDFVCYAVEYAAQEKGALKAVDYSAKIWGWGSREFVPLPHSALFREIFGNPFRPVTILPEWRSEAVVGLAVGIYEDRAFERLPILADALEEAGCENEDIFAHCREPGVHVRGCWVVDLVLGKE